MDTAEKPLYQVKTSAFEGPLELLLDLIEKRKLLINEISLAQVTDDYIAFIKEMQSKKDEAEDESSKSKLYGDITSFVIVAATLILIKSKSLLPTLELADEEKEQIGSLEERLRLYKAARAASDNIKKLFGKSISFAPEERTFNDVVFHPDERISVDLMRKLAEEVLHSIPKKVFLQNVEVKQVISIEEMISNLTDRIQASLSTSFSEFSGGSKGVKTKEEKVFVIVSFLAMLELVREGILDVLQHEHFQDIHLTKREAVEESADSIFEENPSE